MVKIGCTRSNNVQDHANKNTSSGISTAGIIVSPSSFISSNSNLNETWPSPTGINNKPRLTFSEMLTE